LSSYHLVNQTWNTQIVWKNSSSLTVSCPLTFYSDLGVHIDGYIAVAAATVIVGGENGAAPAPITGPAADAIAAAYIGAEVAIRLIKEGATNTTITQAIQRVGTLFGVSPVAGTLSHLMKQYIIDSDKTIIARTEDPEARVEEFNFGARDVIGLDIAYSSGDGKPKESDARKTTVFKRSVETTYSLKLGKSRQLLAEIGRTAPVLPFSLRSYVPALETEASTRLAVLEPVSHGLLQPFPILLEKEGAIVGHVKTTVLMLPGGVSKATGIALPSYVHSDKLATLPDDIKALLAVELGSKKKKKAAAKAAAANDVEMK
jgi:curved DNA binding protein